MSSSNLTQKINNVRCLICDVDGVLTNGFLYLNTEGKELKAFHVHDGMGLKLLLCAGIEVAVITTTNNNIIDKRMEQLGVKHFFKGQVNKQAAFDTLKARLNLPNDAFAYIGDDLPDLPLIQQVGFGVAVANAVDDVKQAANWQTQKPGGGGGVRELCDLILNTQNKREAALDNYLTESM
ncbi:MAG: HAD-IIIA family hydrolase [Gammaproteobacteria bacterium]|nr:HAD-IIIA family hydrolase [Gammaproteobacteria bacterium]